MFIYAIKGSTLKFAAAMVLSLALLITLVILVPKYDAAPTFSQNGKEIVFDNIRTDADRRAFLLQFGHEVSDKEPFYEEVSIPREFDALFTAYNDLQKTQGLDLSKYGGKTMHHYRYELKNHESGKTVYANLLIYRARVVGGDLSEGKLNGFVEPFFKEPTLTPPPADSTTQP